MLVSFSVANFRSFHDEATLTMVASARISCHPNHLVEIPGQDKKLLRCCVIYGANAAGKSNLIDAMAIAQELICVQTDNIPPVQSFRFCKDPTKDPSSFEFRFVVGNHVFTYGFDVRVDIFESEWLSVLDGENEITLFTRDESGKVTLPEESHLKKMDSRFFATLQALSTLPVKRGQLFLNRAISFPEGAIGTTLSSILRWFDNDLVIIRPNHRSDRLISELVSKDQFREFCQEFLKNVGTGIDELDIEEHEVSDDVSTKLFGRGSRRGRTIALGNYKVRRLESNRIMEKRLIAKHSTDTSGNKHRLPFQEESDGTQQLLHLMPYLALSKSKSRVIVIDELDRSLHPLICWEYIKFFSESSPKAMRQLIVTTHEAHLLDQDLLRRDEYWFVEKDSSQQSRMVSLVDFKIRNDLQLKKGYLQGRFGAIPLIGNMSELIRLCEDEDSVS